MASLERYRGHFYNWYDTQNLKPLLPMYVSTVDSGNLAAHLLTLRVGLLALADQPILQRRVFEGLADTLGVACESPAGGIAAPDAELRRELDAAVAAGVTTLGDARRRLDRLATLAGKAASSNAAAVLAAADSDSQQAWIRALLDQCRAARDELALLAPWTSLAAPPSGLEGLLPNAQLPTLREIAGLEVQAQPVIAQALAAERDDARRAWLAALRGPLPRVARSRGSESAASRNWPGRPTSSRFRTSTSCTTRVAALLTIGYNVTERRRDPSHYDLLASEAGSAVSWPSRRAKCHRRTGSRWVGCSRSPAANRCCVSWSGSMFEYLMPLLVMPDFPGTLLGQTSRSAVRRQIEYGKQRGIPWGMSESGYNTGRRAIATTSTALSACRAWVCSAAWRTTWSSPPTRRPLH